MSEYDREIVESIRKAAGTDLKDDIQIVQASVTNVNTTTGYTCDCTPISGDSTTPFIGVLLSASNNDSFILVPALKSTVLVAVSTKNNPPYVIGCDTLQGVICVVQNPDNTLAQLMIQNGTMQLINNSGKNNLQLLLQNGMVQLSNGANNATLQMLMQNGTIQLNDGSSGGIPVNSEILSNLNALISYMNTQFTTIGNALNLCQPYAGTPPSGIGSDVLTNTSTDTPTMQDMENTKITHGV